MTVDTFRQLLPALQHTARFPTCKLDVVCKLYGWDETAVRAALEEFAGGIADWDETTLADVADQLGVELPTYQRPARVAGALLNPEAKPTKVASIKAQLRALNDAPAPAAPAPRRGPSPAQPARLWLNAKRPRLTQIAPHLEPLQASPDGMPSESDWADTYVSHSAHAQFRLRYFASAAPGAELVGEFLAWFHGLAGRPVEAAVEPVKSAPASTPAPAPAPTPPAPAAAARVEQWIPIEPQSGPGPRADYAARYVAGRIPSITFPSAARSSLQAHGVADTQTVYLFANEHRDLLLTTQAEGERRGFVLQAARSCTRIRAKSLAAVLGSGEIIYHLGPCAPGRIVLLAQKKAAT